MDHLKAWIVRCLVLLSVLTWGGGISGSLWAGLHFLGDDAGAAFAQGTFWGLGVCWGLTLMALLGLLTTHALQSEQPIAIPLPSKDQTPPSRSR